MILLVNDSLKTYEPTVFDNYRVPIEIDGRILELNVWDTAGQDDYVRVRHLSYTDTDIFMLCFSIDSQESFNCIEDKVN